MAAAARPRRGARCSASCASRLHSRRRSGEALSGVFAPGQPTAPSLDGLERAPARRRHERGRRRADAARPAHASALATRSRPPPTRRSPHVLAARRARARRRRDRGRARATSPSSTARTEDAWLRDRFHPGRLDRAVELVAGTSPARTGAFVVTRREAGIGADGAGRRHRARACRRRHRRPGRRRRIRDVVLRRRRGQRLTVIADASGVHGRRAAGDDGRRRSGVRRVRRAAGDSPRVLGAALALIAGPPLVRAVRDALAAVLSRDGAPAPLPRTSAQPTSPTCRRRSCPATMR